VFGLQSLRSRLIFQLGVIAAVLSIFFFFAVQSVSRQAAQEMQDNILAASTTSISEAVRVERNIIRLELPYSALSMLGAISEDRVFYRVTQDGATLTGYDDLPVSPPDDPSEISFATLEYRTDRIRSATRTRRVSIDGRPREIIVTVAQTREGFGQVSAHISLAALLIGLGFFVLAVALSAFAAGRTLRPLDRLAQAVARRGPSDLRPVNAVAPTEIAPLVESLNRFIQRLKASLTRSEDFIAEAAHRVRTPLATVRAQAEIALRRVERPENKAALRQMIRAVDESSRSAGQLLDHAMVTFRVDHMEFDIVDLSGMLAETVERFVPLAGLKDIILRLTPLPTSAELKCDPVLLQNAIRNIIDNAIKYSPVESEIRISLTTDSQEYTIAVSDQGRGFAGMETDQLSERFSRGPNAGDIVGSGLGLTICKEVAIAHGGRLELKGNSGRGACVSLILPH
jgi:two-component system sensor histidine kinase TctE